MKIKDIVILTAIVLFLIIMFGILIVGFMNVKYQTESYQTQCKTWGYNTYLNDGWNGDYCVGNSESIQVLVNDGKLSRIKK